MKAEVTGQLYNIGVEMFNCLQMQKNTVILQSELDLNIRANSCEVVL